MRWVDLLNLEGVAGNLVELKQVLHLLHALLHLVVLLLENGLNAFLLLKLGLCAGLLVLGQSRTCAF